MKNKFTIGRIARIIIIFTIFSFQTNALLAQANLVIKNIVIVHGAFTDASGFESVYKILTKDGYRVTLVQNPLTSLKDDVDVTIWALERLDGAAVLVGHSWGDSMRLPRQGYHSKSPVWFMSQHFYSGCWRVNTEPLSIGSQSS